MPILKNCAECGKQLKLQPAYVRKNNYCSYTCVGKARTRRTKENRKPVPCGQCGKLLYKQPRYIARSRSGKVFCNRTCFNRYRRDNIVGEKSSNWSGDNVTYEAMHMRVSSIKGRPKLCQVCGMDDISKHYDWANITGDYTNIDDYVRLCRSCHRLFDNARKEDPSLTIEKFTETRFIQLSLDDVKNDPVPAVIFRQRLDSIDSGLVAMRFGDFLEMADCLGYDGEKMNKQVRKLIRETYP